LPRCFEVLTAEFEIRLKMTSFTPLELFLCVVPFSR